MLKLYKNGFIIKSYEEGNLKVEKFYRGINRYVTWPLDGYTDPTSSALTDEAIERWLGYDDERLDTVPDLDYLQRYTEHCNRLDIPVFCLQVESTVPIVKTTAEPKIEEVLGFDYSEPDMYTSWLWGDLYVREPYVQEALRPVRERLNANGLIQSIEDVEAYLAIRDQLIAQSELDDPLMERYPPAIVRLSRVSLS